MKKTALALTALLMLLPLAGCAEARGYVYSPAIENAYFERGDLTGWTVTGDFSVTEDPDGRLGAETRYLAQSSAEGTGELVSSSFTLGGTGYLSFLIGAGDGCYVDVCEGDAVLLRVENPYFAQYGDGRMRRVLIDLRPKIGQDIVLKIVDFCSDSEYSYINVDDFDVNVTETDLAAYKGTGAVVLSWQ